MSFPRNIELPPWYGQCHSLGVQASLKLKQTSHFFNIFREEKDKICINSLQPGHLEAEQNVRK